MWWDVLWEDGHQSEMPVGTQADHTPLRVAIGGGIRNPDSIKRSLQALDGQIKQVAKFCQSLMSGYGSLRVQDRLLAVIGQVCTGNVWCRHCTLPALSFLASLASHALSERQSCVLVAHVS